MIIGNKAVMKKKYVCLFKIRYGFNSLKCIFCNRDYNGKLGFLKGLFRKSLNYYMAS